ncbi:DUF6809 domain-containing protein, partial [Dysosmobacter welbionis]
SNQGVRAGGAGVDLVVHQMVQFQEVHVAHGDLVVEGLTGAAIVQHALALRIQARLLQQLLNVAVRRAVEDGGGHLPAQLLGGVAQMDL